jgi:tetratricopeptide (TPR) repeat protein
LILSLNQAQDFSHVLIMKWSGLVAIIWFLVCFLHPAFPQEEASRSHFNRGVALQQKGDLEGARQAYEQALKLAPQRVDALANLGLVFLNQGKNEQAIEHFSKALSLKPDLANVRMFLGLAHFRTNQFEAAARELSQVLAAQPDHPQALHLLGLCLLKLDRMQEGIITLEAALQAASANTDAAYTLATAYIGSGEIEKAEALLAGPLRGKESAEAHLVRGSLLNAQREAKAALEELTKAKQMNEKLPTLRAQLGYAYLLLIEYEKAAAEFLTALEQNPNDFHANAYLGWLYIQEKRYAEAAERLATVLRQKPDNATILYQLGQIQQFNGQVEKALETLERAVALRPDFISAHVLLARVYSKLKRTEDFAREQKIIRRLTQEEQERNLGMQENYVEQENSLPKFTEGLTPKANPTRKIQK